VAALAIYFAIPIVPPTRWLSLPVRHIAVVTYLGAMISEEPLIYRNGSRRCLRDAGIELGKSTLPNCSAGRRARV